jgi:SNF2 family DNA or RNA helicase
MQYKAHEYQQHATDHVIDNKASALFLDMGLGKTVSTLTAIDQLMYVYFEVSKVLVIAPKRVAEDTWTGEAKKWDHLKHLKISLVLGTERQRKEALLKKADIFVINRENVCWLVAFGQGYFPYDMVVIDELSSFKSAKSARFKALRMVRPKVNRVVGLTGTPAPNSLVDLWPQLYLLDQGERLGKTITGYRDKYFNASQRNGHNVYKYEIKKTAEQEIYDKIADICISMKAKDYLSLPERIELSVPVTLNGATLAKYYAFEKSLVLALNEADDLSVANAAALTNKLLQYANGAVYDDERNVHEVHNDKIEALEEIVEAANGKPVLVFYSYRHDVDRIKKHLKAYKPEELQGSSHIALWNEGKVPFLLCHPASAGHGLNMQAGGNIIVWFGLPWSLELYMQANARLDRQGQKQSVIIHHLITTGTMDEDVIQALTNKAIGQEALMLAVKARIKKYL